MDLNAIMYVRVIHICMTITDGMPNAKSKSIAAAYYNTYKIHIHTCIDILQVMRRAKIEELSVPM